ncbi:MAG: hypothetical protein ISS74_08965, partial [Planctomycetes bacterium]|nr:hypothetical protein [Planctomycetota bacterium]
MNVGAIALLALAADTAPDGSGDLGRTLAENWYLIALLAAVAGVALLLILYLVKYLRLAVNLFLDTPLP